ncbi:U4/U6 X U5 tri-snRNP complex subunit Snu66 [Schizosaccharomyces cryophilus OY26]|uniref:U4/U6 X U5 tri-snRNP complex subunit Snu66 n=1 Tax=Schizosaccharomyces cryophilus (strain OY26 / ATCC MYA-4695 / CBS 11777 / NBRC 106824 / NRRL Y48691) TaxID=653667 RepID=S9VT01_SCHCR|nr:U4/U6 X U5 tri-snRNP complex subunit Snu66 [Schizosaccharomyces cryophilus OY26]EPY51003.1 U4/U6 X U5 tri-snRNP complex subunit Snu66 [Schizosaccharomyces cryophilus OY26]
MSTNVGATDSMSIEETNKLRVSLGLKPLDVSGDSRPSEPDKKEQAGSSLDQEAIALQNWKEEEEKKSNERKQQEFTSRIQSIREKNDQRRRVQGKSLADILATEEEEEAQSDDTRSWVLKMRAKALEKRTSESSGPKETPRPVKKKPTKELPNGPDTSLEGMRIAHELQKLNSENGLTLTLRDSDILESNDGDLLESNEIAQQEALSKKLEEQKANAGYKPYEDEEEVYNDSAPKKDGTEGITIIGENNALFQGKDAREEESSVPNRGIRISLSETTSSIPEVSDYRDIKIKKSKKNRSREDRRKRKFDDLNDDEFQSTTTTEDNVSEAQNSTFTAQEKQENIKKKIQGLNSQSVVEDDDLQEVLALQRRTAQKRARSLRPEQIAEHVQNQNNVEEEEKEDENDTRGMIIDDTRSFVDSLQQVNDTESSVSLKEKESEQISENPYTVTIPTNVESSNDIPVQEEPIVQNTEPQSTTDKVTDVLEDEPLVSGGVGTVLNILKNKGVVKVSAEAQEKIRKEDEYNRWFAKKQSARRKLEEQRRLQKEQDRASGKLNHMTQKEREQYAKRENEKWDRLIAKVEMEQFQDYKPQVNIRYVDEFGVELGPKEAYKYLLSHQFHGKGSGKAKTEKRLRKIEDMKKQERKPIFE